MSNSLSHGSARRRGYSSLLLSIPIVKLFQAKVCHFGSNFDGACGINRGLILNLRFITPKGTSLRDFASFEENPSTGLTCRRVLDKKV